MDALLLARIQFAANISFHIIFPATTIAMAWVLVFFKLAYQYSKKPEWLTAYSFWVKIFALCFAMGVVSGITMSFQFGTNWPGFMEKVGNVAGPLLAYEVLSAFFLEATFVGIMLFGIKRVNNTIHSLATFLVALGTSLSAFWILVLNSWMQTPAGYDIIDGKIHAADWMQIIFNPSMPYRTMHMLIASGVTCAFLLAGLSAYRLLRGNKGKDVTLSLKTGLVMAALLVPLQIFAGDLHGLNTLKYQPAKVAAMEALWKTKKGAPLLLFAIPDDKQKMNKYELAIPGGASLILTHDIEGEVRGLEEFGTEHPPVFPVFWGFRIMVGIGLLMLVVAWSGLIQLWFNGTISKFTAKILTCMSFSGWIATITGWYVTEIGRQPYLVQGILTTKDAASNVPGRSITVTLTIYLLLYVFLLFSFVTTIFYMVSKVTNEDKKA